jgi:hypothetical protein
MPGLGIIETRNQKLPVVNAPMGSKWIANVWKRGVKNFENVFVKKFEKISKQKKLKRVSGIVKEFQKNLYGVHSF